MSNRKLLLLGIVLITVEIGIAADFSLIGSGAAADVPFVFGEGSPSAASYTSAQIEQASIASHDLAGVPPVSYAADNATLDFPVVGGGSTLQGTTEKKVADLKKLFDSRVEPDNFKVHEEAIHIGISHPGDYTIEQVSAIFSYLIGGDNQKKGWSYVSDPRGVNDFFYANETITQGGNTDPKCVGGGGCADFAILMSALVESIGGTTRIVLASNNTTGGHAYAEVYLGLLNDPNGQVDAVINWIRQDFETDKIFVNINTSTKEVWLNLDWWPDQVGNPHPGGPFFTGDKNIVLYIRENYKKYPLNLPGKANKPPKLISLISDKTSPQVAGTAVTWTAEAKDPENDQIFYKFFLDDNPATKWITDNTWVWTTTDNNTGENQIEVHIRDGKYGHALQNGFDDHKSSSFNITTPETKPITTTITKPSQTAPASNAKIISSITLIPSTNTIGPSQAAPAPATQPAPIVQADNDNRNVDMGVDLAKQGLYEQALDAFNRQINLVPGESDRWNTVWAWKAAALYKLGRYEEAREAIVHELQLNQFKENTVDSLINQIGLLGKSNQILSDADVQDFTNQMENNSNSPDTQAPDTQTPAQTSDSCCVAFLQNHVQLPSCSDAVLNKCAYDAGVCPTCG